MYKSLPTSCCRQHAEVAPSGGQPERGACSDKARIGDSIVHDLEANVPASAAVAARGASVVGLPLTALPKKSR